MREMECGPTPASGSHLQTVPGMKLAKEAFYASEFCGKTGIPEAQVAFLLASGKKVLFLWK
jgi:hypothetical protein